MPPLATNFIEEAFSPLINLFESILVFIHEHLVISNSWGMAIVGLTVLVRAVLVPLTFRQLKSMQEMQRLAPQIKALKEKYADDKQRQQQEIMKFYQEHKVNPLASCLPLLLQIPVFISLFYMLRTDLKLDICGKQLREFYSRELGRPILTNGQIPQNAVTVKGHATTVAGHTVNVPTGSHVVKGLSEIGCSTPFQSNGATHIIAPGSAKFLFIPDITWKATGAALAVLVVLYVASQVGSTLMATATADANQRRLMLILPLVFIFILYRYPAGLLVYWITTNLWTVGQQAAIRRYMAQHPAAPEQGPPDGSGGGGGGSPNGKPEPPKGGAPKAEPALAGVGRAAQAPSRPPPQRKKKKRSGRRR
jgi:YidC/Oxa1 family membrane protein insertase